MKMFNTTCLIILSFIFLFHTNLKSQNISGIINHYQNVLEYDFCKNSVTVPNATNFTDGDKVLLIQMKGAEIDTSNTINSGEVLNYGNAGNYEFAIIKEIIGNTIYLRDSIMRSYDNNGSVQIIKVPIYSNATITDTLKCQPWNGLHGGILVFEVTGTLTMSATIDVRNSGFRGGLKYYCFANYDATSPLYVMPSHFATMVKGEGISSLPQHLMGARGTVANGGGASGAQPYSAGLTDAWYNGGGGGANFGNGGMGGKSSTILSTQYHGGLGGRSLNYSSITNKIFMAGGGGVGHHRYETTGDEYGTDGGGTVIIKTNTLITNNNNILANALDVPFNYNNVGRSGGGAGGTVLLEVQNYNGNLNINVSGGKGGDNNGGQKVGPGGGGGGGIVWVSQASVPANLNITANGGANGMHTSSSDAWGSTPGQAGGSQTNLTLLQTNNALFVPVAQTTNIVSNSPLCVGDTLFLSTGPVPPNVSYSWEGPNGFTSTLQNPFIDSISTIEAGTYSLEVIVQGCPGPKAFSDIYVGTYPPPPLTTNDSVCIGNPNPPLFAYGNNINWYADSLLNNHLANDTAYYPTVSSVGTYYFYATQSDSVCESSFSISHLEVLPSPLPPHVNDQIICYGDSILPFVATGNGIINWYSDSLLINHIHTGETYLSTDSLPGIYYYYVTIFDTVYSCVSLYEEVTLVIIPLPYAFADNDTSICHGESLQLNVDASFNSVFIWSNGDTTQQITVNPITNTTFYVTVDNGCGIATDSINVTVFPLPIANAGTDTSICYGQSTTLSASGGQNYLWSHNAGNTANVIVSPLTTTNFTVSVTDLNNCTNTDDVNVTVDPLPVIEIIGDTLICEGDTAILSASGGQSYIWNTGDNSSLITVAPVIDESYFVTVTNNYGCQDSLIHIINVINTFYITLSSDFAPLHTITEGQMVTFTATPPTYLLFDFFINNMLKQSSSSNIFKTATLENNDMISVIAYNMDCPSIADSVKIKVQQLPNAFTPFESDGVNQLFAKGMDLTILNRWGQEIYKGNEGWNGEYKNNKVAPGTYYYIIELNKGTSNAKILTGSINVVVK